MMILNIKKIAALTVMAITIAMSVITVSAEEGTQKPSGQMYEFEDDNKYIISEATSSAEISGDASTYGLFSIAGDVSDISVKDGVQAYKAENGVFKLSYTYSDEMLTDDKDTLHLKDDSCKSFDGMDLEGKIGKGLILLQTSKDRNNWVTVYSQLNAFSDNPKQNDSFYTTTESQLNNGCFLRLIIAYETEIRTGTSKILFVDVDEMECKRHAEVYEIYVYNENAENDSSTINQKYSLGSKVRTDKYEGYYGETEISNSDVHYGWDLGNFFVSGYTSTAKDENGNVVFLKNVGDKVTLYFNLKQDISCLNGNDKLSISADTAGSDRYFETATQNFGKGTLIVRYTDYENVTHDPVIYTNYLEANVTAGSDTIVQLSEEGDYEVALDYQITEDKLFDQKSHYRIFFKYSVRNGNCMVFPFDVKTGSELTNTSITENGFYLDLAKSRYLKITIKKEVLTEGADGLCEDTRFNKAAKDGEKFTDEGIYTITVSNQYTGQVETKKIYVGTNDILKATVVNNLSVSDVNQMLANGFVINDDGTLRLVGTNSTDDIEDTAQGDEETKEIENTGTDESNNGLIVIIIALSVLLLGAVVLIVIKYAKKDKEMHK